MPAFSLIRHLAALTTPQPILPGVDDDPRTVLGWTPKNDCAFVLPLIEADRSRGGQFILPDQAREKPQKGVVIAVGAGLWDDEQRKLYPVEVNVGDLVTYGKYSGESFEIGGVDGTAPLAVFIMKNIEIKARCKAGNYPALTEHLLGEGTPNERHVYHEPHLSCEYCPAPAPSAVIEEEREKLRQQHAAALAE